MCCCDVMYDATNMVRARIFQILHISAGMQTIRFALHLQVFLLFSRSSSALSMSTAASKLTNQKRRFILHWFRLGDLRVHDNPALVHSKSLLASAIGSPTEEDVILPLFCFDNKIFGNCALTKNARSIKCGVRRAKFILESVTDLRKQLQKECNSELLVAYGDPAHVIDRLVDYIFKTYGTSNIRVVCQQEVASEELQAVKDVKTVLHRHYPNSVDKLILEIWGSTMHNLCDLPYDRVHLNHLPSVFTAFRKEIEKKCTIQRPLPIPRYLPFPKDWPASLPNDGSSSILGDPLNVSPTYLPTLQELGYTEQQVQEAEQHDPRGVMIFRGGESAGMARVQQFIWEQDLLKDYYDTRNGMIGADYSTKFSPWLAHGCLSPRYIVAECSRYEMERVKNKSTYWVVFELLWRDYCKFYVVKYKHKIFLRKGIHYDEIKSWNMYKPSFEAWKEGRTGYPLIDANMRELKATGFMSNRGRQNVASFLALDLQYDWRYGGDWFESTLIDYDVYSNWVVRQLIVIEFVPCRCNSDQFLILNDYLELVRRRGPDTESSQSFQYYQAKQRL
jgi:deoxyribodipyrimidine photo-lyase